MPSKQLLCYAGYATAKPNASVLQAVFERLVDMICEKMSESLDTTDPSQNSTKGTRLTDTAQPSNVNCNC